MLTTRHCPHSSTARRAAVPCSNRSITADPADATAIPKPHHLLPHIDPDRFYLSGTGYDLMALYKSVYYYYYPRCPGKEAVKRV